MQATASINFVTKFRLAVPIEKMEARWKQVTDIDRIHRQQSCIREGLDSLYVLRAVGAWERIFAKMEKTLSDGRPWIMGNEISLVETTHAPFIKVLDLLRLLDLWLEDISRPKLAVVEQKKNMIYVSSLIQMEPNLLKVIMKKHFMENI